MFFDGSPEIVLDRFQKLTVNSQRRQRPAERNVEKNCGERKKPAGMALWGAAAASAADRDGWHNLLAGLKSPHGPDED